MVQGLLLLCLVSSGAMLVSMVQQFPVQREQPRFLGAWPEWKCGSVRGLNTFPHRIVGKKLLPEPGMETGPAAVHTQSRGVESPRSPAFASLPFSEDGNSQNNMRVKKVQCMFRNTGRGTHLRSQESFASFYYKWEKSAVREIPP